MDSIVNESSKGNGSRQGIQSGEIVTSPAGLHHRTRPRQYHIRPGQALSSHLTISMPRPPCRFPLYGNNKTRMSPFHAQLRSFHPYFSAQTKSIPAQRRPDPYFSSILSQSFRVEPVFPIFLHSSLPLIPKPHTVPCLSFPVVIPRTIYLLCNALPTTLPQGLSPENKRNRSHSARTLSVVAQLEDFKPQDQ